MSYVDFLRASLGDQPSEKDRRAAWACGEPDGKPCTVPDCPWCHANPSNPQLTPEDPAKVKGPEIGALMRYVYGPVGHRWHGIVVRVIERSYVWSPERRNYDGTYGYRHYEWSVIEYRDRAYAIDSILSRPPSKMVVEDVQLFPIELGDKIAPQEAE